MVGTILAARALHHNALLVSCDCAAGLAAAPATAASAKACIIAQPDMAQSVRWILTELHKQKSINSPPVSSCADASVFLATMSQHSCNQMTSIGTVSRYLMLHFCHGERDNDILNTGACAEGDAHLTSDRSCMLARWRSCCRTRCGCWQRQWRATQSRDRSWNAKVGFSETMQHLHRADSCVCGRLSLPQRLAVLLHLLQSGLCN